MIKNSQNLFAILIAYIALVSECNSFGQSVGASQLYDSLKANYSGYRHLKPSQYRGKLYDVQVLGEQQIDENLLDQINLKFVFEHRLPSSDVLIKEPNTNLNLVIYSEEKIQNWKSVQSNSRSYD